MQLKTENATTPMDSWYTTNTYVTGFDKTLLMGFFVKIEFDASSNSPASFRLIAHFALEIARFVCDYATTIENEKIGSKGVATYVYSVFVYYA